MRKQREGRAKQRRRNENENIAQLVVEMDDPEPQHGPQEIRGNGPQQHHGRRHTKGPLHVVPQLLAARIAHGE